MAKGTKSGNEGTQGKSSPKTKLVRNRSNGKIELYVDNKVVVIRPKETVELPWDFNVPNGIGLYEK